MLRDASLSLGEQGVLVDTAHCYELMRRCRAAIANSGTVTLELGLHKVPTVVVYRMAPLNAFVAKYLFRIRLPYYCIVNIVSEAPVYPELIHTDATVEHMAEAAYPLLEESTQRATCLADLETFRQRLRSEGSAHTIASALMELIDVET